MKPSARIDSFKLEFLLEDAITKIAFLGKINESEDNSSELAGFEINKLLKEQTKLEQDYASLIKQRSQLKGISNREEHKKVEDKITNVSRSLKENTKKLCRLFKENTNLDNDSKKVGKEREELITSLASLLQNIDRNSVDQFIEGINKELEEENKLGDFLRIEKDLATKIKDLKQKIAEETKEFEDIRKEKKNMIHQLREEVTKAQTESAAKLSYEKKVSETKVATSIRINNQKFKTKQKEQEQINQLFLREKEVFSKLETFFKDETKHFEEKIAMMKDYKEKQKDIIKRERLRLELESKKAQIIIENLSKELEKDKAAQLAEEERILKLLKDKEEEELRNKVTDDKMKVIQQQFEEWMRLVGPKSKPRGGSKPKPKP